MDEVREALAGRLAAAGVTPREQDVFWGVASRRRNREIAEQLYISERTVESHVASLLRKLGGTRRQSLVDMAEQARARAGHSTVPAVPSSFVGRTSELAALHALVARHRLVTLTGTAGAGKTRLALEAARTAPGMPPATLVDLAAVAVHGDVDDALATAIAVFPGDDDTAGVLRAAVVAGRHWLVLDNAEHVLVGLRSRLTDLLGAAGHLRVLATSRSPLGLPGEVVYEVEPLSLPPETDDPVAVLASDAGRLFADRAAMALPGFSVDTSTARAVAGICRRLDGLPLAIELAAARVRAFTPIELAAHLQDRFELLASPWPGVGGRHATLNTALGWSHDLLSSDERRLFERCAIFAGDFDYDAAEQVTAFPPLDQAGFPVLFARLFDRSLLAARRHEDGRTRYRMLQTVRVFARDRLASSGELDQAARRHAEYHLRRAVVVAAQARGSGQSAALRAFDRLWPNLHPAMQWARTRDAALGWEFLANLGVAWETIGVRPGVLDWVDAMVARDIPPGAIGMRARTAAAWLLTYRDPDRGVALAQEAVGMATATPRDRAVAEVVLGWALSYQDAHARGREYLLAAIGELRRSGDRWHEALALQALGVCAADPTETAHLADSGRLFAEVGDRVKQANVLVMLAARRIDSGNDLRSAAAELETALDLATRTGNVHEQLHARLHLARLDHVSGRAASAQATYVEVLASMRELGDRRCVARCLLGLGQLAVEMGDLPAARSHLLACTDEARGVRATTQEQAARRLLASIGTHEPEDDGPHPGTFGTSGWATRP